VALSPVSRHDLIRKFRNLGFSGPFTGGRHSFMNRGKLKVPIPNEHHTDIGVPLLRRILKRAGIEDDDWLSA